VTIGRRYLDEWLRLASAASGEAAQLDKPEIPITLVKASRCKHDGSVRVWKLLSIERLIFINYWLI
jgi:hypothetical protein